VAAPPGQQAVEVVIIAHKKQGGVLVASCFLLNAGPHPLRVDVIFGQQALPQCDLNPGSTVTINPPWQEVGSGEPPRGGEGGRCGAEGVGGRSPAAEAPDAGEKPPLHGRRVILASSWHERRPPDTLETLLCSIPPSGLTPFTTASPSSPSGPRLAFVLERYPVPLPRRPFSSQTPAPATPLPPPATATATATASGVGTPLFSLVGQQRLWAFVQVLRVRGLLTKTGSGHLPLALLRLCTDHHEHERVHRHESEREGGAPTSGGWTSGESPSTSTSSSQVKHLLLRVHPSCPPSLWNVIVNGHEKILMFANLVLLRKCLDIHYMRQIEGLLPEGAKVSNCGLALAMPRSHIELVETIPQQT
jgi:hypothetical protein